jgi:hypothetical protein
MTAMKTSQNMLTNGASDPAYMLPNGASDALHSGGIDRLEHIRFNLSRNWHVERSPSNV